MTRQQRKFRRQILGSHDRWMGEGRAYLMRERLASGDAVVSGKDLGPLYVRSTLVVPEHVRRLEHVHVIGIPTRERFAAFAAFTAPPRPDDGAYRFAECYLLEEKP